MSDMDMDFVLDDEMPFDHELKIWPRFFEAVQSGKKTFELRKDDRGFKVGDRLLLREWIPDSKKYTGRELTVTVTYIMTSGPWLQPGIACLGISVPKNDDPVIDFMRKVAGIYHDIAGDKDARQSRAKQMGDALLGAIFWYESEQAKEDS